MGNNPSIKQQLSSHQGNPTAFPIPPMLVTSSLSISSFSSPNCFSVIASLPVCCLVVCCLVVCCCRAVPFCIGEEGGLLVLVHIRLGLLRAVEPCCMPVTFGGRGAMVPPIDSPSM